MSNFDTVVLDGEMGLFTKVREGDLPYYTGATEVTPSDETQTLPTADTIVTSNITINPIPDIDLEEVQVTYTPDEEGQTDTITPSTGYVGISEVEVTVEPIDTDYVGSGIARNDSDDLTVSGAAVTAPAGYYAANASASVASGTEGTPTAAKGAVSNHSVAVTPSVTNAAGYISGGTHTGTAVTVSASELVSGDKSITANGTNIDVAEYATVSVAVPGDTPNLETKSVSYTPTESQQTAQITASTGYDGLEEVDITVGAISSTYVGSGITRRSSTDLSASGATVSAPAGYYENGVSKAVASGSATTPATTITANPSIIVNSSTGVITATASASESVTPTVSAGYVSSGTAGTVTVSGSATEALSTQAAQTITPTGTAQTAVAANKYTTGATTVEAVVCSNLTAENIVSGVTVKIGTATDDDSVASVTGTASGGGGQEDEILTRSITGVYSNDRITTISNALAYSSEITGLELPNLISNKNQADGCFRNMSNLTYVRLPMLSSPSNNFNYAFMNCSKLASIAFPSWKSGTIANVFEACSLLASVDLALTGISGTNCFKNCSALNILVLRRDTAIVNLTNISAFNGTPFASGGTGGTIYIPKTLYEALGTGTANDYKAASNWSTIDGYGTITWAKIEGSYYETHYADGTTIPTT